MSEILLEWKEPRLSRKETLKALLPITIRIGIRSSIIGLILAYGTYFLLKHLKLDSPITDNPYWPLIAGSGYPIIFTLIPLATLLEGKKTIRIRNNGIVIAGGQSLFFWWNKILEYKFGEPDNNHKFRYLEIRTKDKTRYIYLAQEVSISKLETVLASYITPQPEIKSRNLEPIPFSLKEKVFVLINSLILLIPAIYFYRSFMPKSKNIPTTMVLLIFISSFFIPGLIVLVPVKGKEILRQFQGYSLISSISVLLVLIFAVATIIRELIHYKEYLGQ